MVTRTKEMRDVSSRFLVPVVLLAVVAALAVVVWSRLFASAPPHPCEGELSVFLDDGSRVPIALRRCEASAGHYPAVLVVSDRRRVGRAWLDHLDRFTRDGRGLWLAVGRPREPSAQQDVAALIGAIREEAWTDGGRVTVVLSGEPARVVDPYSLPQGVDVVLHDERAGRRDENSAASERVLIIAGSTADAAESARGWIESRQLTREPGSTSPATDTSRGTPSSPVAARTIPSDRTPRSLTGARLATTTTVLPTSSSGS